MGHQSADLYCRRESTVPNNRKRTTNNHYLALCVYKLMELERGETVDGDWREGAYL
jgi:hypothetical protein